jgi:hypothetical protein
MANMYDEWADTGAHTYVGTPIKLDGQPVGWAVVVTTNYPVYTELVETVTSHPGRLESFAHSIDPLVPKLPCGCLETQGCQGHG